ITVHKEYAGGVMAELEVELPAVLGIQAARQMPRYAAVARVRQAMRKTAVEEVQAGEVSVTAGSNMRRMFKPEKGSRAEMLEGSPEVVADKILAKLREKGIKA
ncbi:MAG: electron transfer flavoprotein subunit beta/FixA family protein, partial [Acidobacteriota bacterium]